MVSDASVIHGSPTVEVSEEPPVAFAGEPVAAGAVTDEAPSEPEVAPVTRDQADEFGRAAAKVGASVVRFAGSVAMGIGRIVSWGWRTMEDVPPAVRLLFITGLLAMLSVVGSVGLDNSFGLTCAVVFVPLCFIILGVIGHRWYSSIDADGTQETHAAAADHAASELKRSVEYLDNKLTFALNTLGTEQHQQAVIALFQAKTAVELALGTEQDAASQVDGLLTAQDQDMRPRIRTGSASKMPLRESNSLAAS